MKNFVLLVTLLMIMIACENTSSPISSKIDESKVHKYTLLEELRILDDLINKYYDFSQYKSSTQDLIKEVQLFNGWIQKLYMAEKIDTGEFKTLSIEIRDRISTIQKEEFPLMRMAYMKIAAHEMWYNDIYVTCAGEENKILKFTGGYYAANRHISETQGNLESMFIKLRFIQIQYRWYKGQKEYTYYYLKVPSDAEIKIVL